MSGGPIPVPPRFVERVWGRRDLGPWFGAHADPIGEVWFQPSPDYPLLVKFLYPTARLSVQVHPGDEYARTHASSSRGKTEMWHILAAEPGAEIAIGFREPLTRAQAESAIRSGGIENLLNWVRVKAGETYLAEAGCVHAIGGGLTICEIQQNSDITYRLYDYGRPRELHVEHGLNVANLCVYDGRRELPVRCPYFETEAVEWTGPGQYQPPNGDHLLILIEGGGLLAGQTYAAGQVWHVRDSTPFEVAPSGHTRLLRTCSPA